MLFGMHEYVLRLPVLLAQLFFLVYTYRILNRFGTSFSWLVFIILALNPYVLDYFTLARGYGLSLAFMVMSLYFILNFHQITRSTTAYLALLFALLAAFANFTYSLIFISAAAAVFVVYVQSGRWKKGLLISGLAVLLGFGLLYIPLSALVKANELYYGGEAGFLQDTLVSLTEAFTYYKWPSEWLWMPLVLVCVVLSLFVYSLWINLNRFEKVSPVFLMLLFLLLPAIGSILQHLILGTPFLINRTALFFIPLFLLSLGLLSKNVKGWLQPSVKALVMLFFTLNTYTIYKSYNLEYFVDFKEHADARSAVKTLSSSFEETQAVVSLGKSVYMNATLNFYKFYYQLDWLNHAELDFCDESGEHIYYYLFASDLNCVNNKPVEVLKYFPVSNTYLLKKKIHE